MNSSTTEHELLNDLRRDLRSIDPALPAAGPPATPYGRRSAPRSRSHAGPTRAAIRVCFLASTQAGLRKLLALSGQSAADARALVDQLGRDYRTADLTAADRVMLDYAVKLTHTPATLGSADVAGLRAAGFDHRGIHDICAVTAYYAFVNRIADGLGVELEPRWETEA